MKKHIVIALLTFLYLPILCSQNKKTIIINDTLSVNASLLFSDDFSSDLKNWIAQYEQDDSYVKINNEKMEINSKRGCTVWFNKKIDTPVIIEYDAVMIDEGGKYDRVSDMNCFWMASDPDNPDDFFVNIHKQKGSLGDYNYLSLYYVGFGGRKNTTTRLRRYPGDGSRPMLPEHDLGDPEFLLSGNTVNHIKIINYKGIVQYYRNNQLVFDYKDPKPLTSGHFGIRTTINHMSVDNFKVYSIEPSEY